MLFFYHRNSWYDQNKTSTAPKEQGVQADAIPVFAGFIRDKNA